jgi:hypothetical protein
MLGRSATRVRHALKFARSAGMSIFAKSAKARPGERGDIGHSEPLPCEIRLLAQGLVEVADASECSLPALLTPFRVLVGLDV